MVDYFWLKSFTEIIQLFISVLFLVYLKIKYGGQRGPVGWLMAFFWVKLAGDLYGILNYTPWVVELMTKPVMSFYRTTMGAVELAMFTCLVLFVLSFNREFSNRKKIALYFVPSALMLLLAAALQYIWGNSLLELFYVVKLVWILGTAYLLIRHVAEPALRVLVGSILLWSIIWLIEVFSHEAVGAMSESVSMALFVLAEFCFTLGLAYYLVKVVAKPKILKVESSTALMPDSLRQFIETNLNSAFEQQGLYKNPELDLTGLATLIGVSSTELTTYLNRIVKKNFNQYLIDHRIKETEKLLKESGNQKQTIEQIMFSAGFNSKSVFNTAFKQRNGCTPSQYRKQHQSA